MIVVCACHLNIGEISVDLAMRKRVLWMEDNLLIFFPTCRCIVC
jgi:hypothetical protein